MEYSEPEESALKEISPQMKKNDPRQKGSSKLYRIALSEVLIPELGNSAAHTT